MDVQLLSEYLEFISVEKGLSDNTISAYRSDLLLFIDYCVQSGIYDPDSVSRNLLNSYEFQRQFIKSKKKYKFMKKIRQKQILLESQDINNNNLEYNIFTENKNMKKKDSTKFENVNNKILTYTNKNKNLMNTIKEKEEENINSKNSNIDSKNLLNKKRKNIIYKKVKYL